MIKIYVFLLIYFKTQFSVTFLYIMFISSSTWEYNVTVSIWICFMFYGQPTSPVCNFTVTRFVSMLFGIEKKYVCSIEH